MFEAALHVELLIKRIMQLARCGHRDDIGQVEHLETCFNNSSSGLPIASSHSYLRISA